jgi:hypothetical protein
MRSTLRDKETEETQNHRERERERERERKREGKIRRRKEKETKKEACCCCCCKKHLRLCGIKSDHHALKERRKQKIKIKIICAQDCIINLHKLSKQTNNQIKPVCLLDL